MSDVLFLGNGINRAFNKVSWSALIKNIHIKYDTEELYDEHSILPMPMQIIVATDDKVDKAMIGISKEMNFSVSSEQKDLLGKILDLPVTDILTTNYTFEIEQAADIENKLYNYRKIRQFTKECTDKDKQFNLYKNYCLESHNKTVWHLHGDIATPSSIIMGNYYYGKLLSEIQSYIPSFIKRYVYSKKNNIALKKYSWVDSFLAENVHMIGFGLDFSETDIWWLICCKKRNFPDSKVYLYQPEKDISSDQKKMLKTYNVEIVDSISFDGEYKEYYVNVITDLSHKLEKNIVSIV